jgi:pyrroline-5-carboxylate reductase
MTTFGFIGTGNMGSAMAKAAAKKLSGEQILLANRTAAKAQALAAEVGGTVTDNRTIAKDADYIFLGVKPQMMADVLAEIAPILAARTDRFLLVTMAGGMMMSRIRELAGGAYPVIRILPNTPSAIGEGIVFYTYDETVTAEEESFFLDAMAGAGMVPPLSEKLMDAGSAVAGCGPAFASMFLEALADGGVACGLPRAAAMEYAAQMMLGTAKLALESGKHPGAMKDAVCSPGGATIQGVRTLEQGGFRGTVMDAVIVACEAHNKLK